MAARLAAQEGDGLALLELPPPGRRAQARAAAEDDQELLLGEVEVVGVGGFARRDLPQAESEPLAPGLAPDTCPQTAEARVLPGLVEDRVRDARQVANATCARGGSGPGGGYSIPTRSSTVAWAGTDAARVPVLERTAPLHRFWIE